MPKLSGHSPPSPSSRRHRHQSSIARSIKSLIDSPLNPPQAGQMPSYQQYPSTSASITSIPSLENQTLSPLRREPDDFGWDIVEDKSIRWATDYVPLAPSGSRLAGVSAVLFATWSDEGRKGNSTGGKLLAIATKSAILLYETPKGERAYKFVKVCLTDCINYLTTHTHFSQHRNFTLLFKLAISLSFNRLYRMLVFLDDFNRINDLKVGLRLRCGVWSILARIHTSHPASALILVFSSSLIKRLRGFV